MTLAAGMIMMMHMKITERLADWSFGAGMRFALLLMQLRIIKPR